MLETQAKKNLLSTPNTDPAMCVQWCSLRATHTLIQPPTPLFAAVFVHQVQSETEKNDIQVLAEQEIIPNLSSSLIQSLVS